VNYTLGPLVPVRGVRSSNPWLYIRNYVNAVRDDQTGNLAVITTHLMSNFNTQYNYMEVYKRLNLLVKMRQELGKAIRRAAGMSLLQDESAQLVYREAVHVLDF